MVHKKHNGTQQHAGTQWNTGDTISTRGHQGHNTETHIHTFNTQQRNTQSNTSYTPRMPLTHNTNSHTTTFTDKHDHTQPCTPNKTQSLELTHDSKPTQTHYTQHSCTTHNNTQQHWATPATIAQHTQQHTHTWAQHNNQHTRGHHTWHNAQPRNNTDNNQHITPEAQRITTHLHKHHDHNTNI